MTEHIFSIIATVFILIVVFILNKTFYWPGKKNTKMHIYLYNCVSYIQSHFNYNLIEAWLSSFLLSPIAVRLHRDPAEQNSNRIAPENVSKRLVSPVLSGEANRQSHNHTVGRRLLQALWSR